MMIWMMCPLWNHQKTEFKNHKGTTSIDLLVEEAVWTTLTKKQSLYTSSNMLHLTGKTNQLGALILTADPGPR